MSVVGSIMCTFLTWLVVPRLRSMHSLRAILPGSVSYARKHTLTPLRCQPLHHAEQRVRFTSFRMCQGLLADAGRRNGGQQPPSRRSFFDTYLPMGRLGFVIHKVCFACASSTGCCQRPHMRAAWSMSPVRRPCQGRPAHLMQCRSASPNPQVTRRGRGPQRCLPRRRRASADAISSLSGCD
jgi:hypothetical protein